MILVLETLKPVKCHYGNIAGAATAIVMGGPGALIWMILAAFVGMATKFAEIALGVKYRKVHEDGTVSGAPQSGHRSGSFSAEKQ